MSKYTVIRMEPASPPPEDQMEKLRRELEQEKERSARLAEDLYNQLLQSHSSMKQDESIYAISRASYIKKDLYKLGKTKHELQKRLSNLNTSTVKEDSLVVYKEIKTSNADILEKIIHNYFKMWHYDKEWFKIPHDILMRELEFIESMNNAFFERMKATAVARLQAVSIPPNNRKRCIIPVGVACSIEPSIRFVIEYVTDMEAETEAVQSADLFAKYMRWCDINNETRKQNKKNFLKLISSELGLNVTRKVHSDGEYNRRIDIVKTDLARIFKDKYNIVVD